MADWIVLLQPGVIVLPNGTVIVQQTGGAAPIVQALVGAVVQPLQGDGSVVNLQSPTTLGGGFPQSPPASGVPATPGVPQAGESNRFIFCRLPFDCLLLHKLVSGRLKEKARIARMHLCRALLLLSVPEFPILKHQEQP